MLIQSLKIGVRRLVNHKSYSAISIIGLGIAISVSLIILAYSFHHFSFDKNVPNSENSYRLISRVGDGSYNANTFACFDDILPGFTAVESHTICYTIHNIQDIFVGEKKIEVKEAIITDESFIDFFSPRMLDGNKQSLDEPNTMLVTPLIANKISTNAGVIGQRIGFRSFTANQDSLIYYTITGIVEPMQKESHMGYDILLSSTGHFSHTVNRVKHAKVFGGSIYVKLSPFADIASIETKLNDKAEALIGTQHGPPLNAFNHHFQSLTDIHFTPNTTAELRPVVRRSSLNILLMVGFLILAIATINFVNMYIARNTFQQKESSIIRFLGGNKRHLFGNMVSELFISIVLSFSLAFVLYMIFNISIARHYFGEWRISFFNIQFIVVAGLLFLFVVVATTIFMGINLLKTKQTNVLSNPSRILASLTPLVVFQFVLVIALMGFTILVNKQMNFIENKDLGYTPENVMVVHVPQVNHKINILREELLKESIVLSAATAQHYPGYRLQDMNFTTADNNFPFKFGFVDNNTIETLNIKPIKYFAEAKEKAINGWMINETFYNNLKSYYTEEQIASSDFPQNDKQSEFDARQKFVILGVISDFNYASLHSSIENFSFLIRGLQESPNRFLLVRFEQKHRPSIINAVEHHMAKIYPGQPINYSFLDEQLNDQYNSEQTLLKLINSFSILSILIGCLGLIGLSIFMSDKRTKEIGIRKVNGAKISEVLLMLSVDFVKWAAIAFVIATPIAYYAMNKWLQNFAYKTEISWWIFALAGFLALGIALLTVSWQSWRAATRNPVEALRYE
jgi:putative ABC transport system permease protein